MNTTTTKPTLMHLIDNCPDTEAVRDEIHNATLSARRAAAQYLGVRFAELAAAAQQRTRLRLSATATTAAA